MNRLFNKFKKLSEQAEINKQTLKSAEYFARLASGEAPIHDFSSVTRGLPAATKLRVGMLVTYEYVAKTDDKLPYWDRYPLVLITKITKTGWYGINFHYLHPQMRARILFEEHKRGIPIIDNETANLSVKQYRADHVQRHPREIPSELFEIVLQMPFENFVRASKQQVWRKTKRGTR